MPSSSSSSTEDYPSLLWIVIPPVILISSWLTRKWYLARKLRLYGIGRGAPGFQTSVRRVRVTPEIAARIRRGEDVSADEITAASAKADADEAAGKLDKPTAGKVEVVKPPSATAEIATPENINEWLPENITGPKKRTKGKRK